MRRDAFVAWHKFILLAGRSVHKIPAGRKFPVGRRVRRAFTPYRVGKACRAGAGSTKTPARVSSRSSARRSGGGRRACKTAAAKETAEKPAKRGEGSARLSLITGSVPGRGRRVSVRSASAGSAGRVLLNLAGVPDALRERGGSQRESQREYADDAKLSLSEFGVNVHFELLSV